MGDIVASIRPLETLAASGLSPITFQFPSWEKSESSDVSKSGHTIARSVADFEKKKKSREGDQEGDLHLQKLHATVIFFDLVRCDSRPR